MSESMVVTDEDISKELSDESKIAIVNILCRPGVRSFMIATEWRLFCPLDEDLNSKFGLVMKRWKDMLFAIMIVPAESRERIEKVAAEFKLRIIDKFPVVIENGSASKFPIHCDGRMYSTEGMPGAAMYENDPTLFDKESELLPTFEEEEKAKARATLSNN